MMGLEAENCGLNVNSSAFRVIGVVVFKLTFILVEDAVNLLCNYAGLFFALLPGFACCTDLLVSW